MTDERNMTDAEWVLTRRVDAPRELVWKAWTEAERLREWFGPRGYTMTSARMDLRPGGMFHYCIRSQDGEPGGTEMWGKWVFREIEPPARLTYISSFSDPDGGTTRHPLAPDWPLEVLGALELAADGASTVMTMRSIPVNVTADDLRRFREAHAQMDGGWKGTLEQLTAYLRGA